MKKALIIHGIFVILFLAVMYHMIFWSMDGFYAHSQADLENPMRGFFRILLTGFVTVIWFSTQGYVAKRQLN